MNQNQNSSEEAVFVDENKNVHIGQKALELIQSRAQESIDPVKGVVRVDPARWQEAQRYERRTWKEGVAAMTDRNEYHESCFGGFAAIAGKSFGSGIELGCGPFTNMRKILTHCDVSDIHLLDPVAADYLSHPFCRYKKRKLGGVFKTALIPWTKRRGFKHPGRFFKHKLDEWQVGKWFGRPISLHATGIEDFNPPKVFDICIMINVIEHCRDVEQIFSRILEMTEPGSYFLFADKIYHADEEARVARFKFDAGHPLRVDYTVVRDFLLANFDPVWDAEIAENEGAMSYKCNYFIGIRRSKA